MQEATLKADCEENANQMMEAVQSQMKQYKKARLVEDRMSYEDLALMDNFDEDEVTFALNR